MVSDLDLDSLVSSAPLLFHSFLTRGTLFRDAGTGRFDLRFGAEGPLELLGRLNEAGRGLELSELVMFDGKLLTVDDRTGTVFELLDWDDRGAPPAELRGRPPATVAPAGIVGAGDGVPAAAAAPGGGAAPRRRVGTAAASGGNLSRAPLFSAVFPEGPAGAAVVTPPPHAPPVKLVPRLIISEGDGSSAKGAKLEWATVKDGALFLGSFGKEFTDNTGLVITSQAPFWVYVVTREGRLERRNWTPIYARVREKLGAVFPGYALHEAVAWAPALRRWVMLPRRISVEPYNELADESRGANEVVIASEAFEEISVVHVSVARPDPRRGFSSFRFVPGSGDRLILAVRSLEGADGQQSFLTIFETLTGRVLLPDVAVPHSAKYEGLEFV